MTFSASEYQAPASRGAGGVDANGVDANGVDANSDAPPGAASREGAGPGPTLRALFRAFTRARFALPLLVASGTAVVAFSAAQALWFPPLVAGLAVGAVSRVRQAGFAATAAALLALGPAAWGIVLLWDALGGAAIGATAHETAALAGLPPIAVVTVVLTLLIALFLAAAGCWLGRAFAPVPVERRSAAGRVVE